MAQPNDVNQILGINKDDIPRRKEIKVKDKKKRPGKKNNLFGSYFETSQFFHWPNPHFSPIEKVNREVFALIGDVPQMAPVEPVTQNLA